MQPVTLEDINDAAKLLDGVIKKTPSISAGWIEKKYGVDVTFKCENLQRAGSFKIRGAYNRIARLTTEQRRKGVVAARCLSTKQHLATVPT